MAIQFKITSGSFSAENTLATINCRGKKLMEDLVIEAVEVSEVKLISFTIAGTTYQAEEGMTWADWCDSEYNTGYQDWGEWYAEYYVCSYVFPSRRVAISQNTVNETDAIIANTNYDIYYD